MRSPTRRWSKELNSQTSFASGPGRKYGHTDPGGKEDTYSSTVRSSRPFDGHALDFHAMRPADSFYDPAVQQCGLRDAEQALLWREASLAEEQRKNERRVLELRLRDERLKRREDALARDRLFVREEEKFLYATKSANGLQHVDASLGAGEQAEGKSNLVVNIIKAEGLTNLDGIFTGKSDPYCICSLKGKEALSKFTTKVIRDDLNPRWDHTGELAKFSPGDILKVEVWDDDFGKDNTIGIAEIPSSAFYPGGFKGDLTLKNAKGSSAGTISIRVLPLEPREVAQQARDQRFDNNMIDLRSPGGVGGHAEPLVAEIDSLKRKLVDINEELARNQTLRWEREKSFNAANSTDGYETADKRSPSEKLKRELLVMDVNEALDKRFERLQLELRGGGFPERETFAFEVQVLKKQFLEMNEDVDQRLNKLRLELRSPGGRGDPQMEALKLHGVADVKEAFAANHLEPRVQCLEEDRSSVPEPVFAELGSMRQRLVEESEEHKRLQRQIESLRAQQREQESLPQQVESLQAQQKEQERLLGQVEGFQSKLQDHERLLLQLESLQTQQQEYKRLQRQVEKLQVQQQEQERLPQQIESLRAKQQDHEMLLRQIDSLQKQQQDYQRLQRQVEHLQAQQQEQERLPQQVESLWARQQEQERLQRQVENVQAKLQDHEKLARQVESLQAQQKEQEGLPQQVESLQAKQQEYQRLQRQVEHLQARQQEQERLPQQVESLQAKQQEQEKLQRQVESVQAKLQDHEKLVRQVESLQAQQKEQARLPQQVEGLQVKQQEHERLQRQVESALAKLQDHEKLVRQVEILEAQQKEHERLLRQVEHLQARQQEQDWSPRHVERSQAKQQEQERLQLQVGSLEAKLQEHELVLRQVESLQAKQQEHMLMHWHTGSLPAAKQEPERLLRQVDEFQTQQQELQRLQRQVESVQAKQEQAKLHRQVEDLQAQLEEINRIAPDARSNPDRMASREQDIVVTYRDDRRIEMGGDECRSGRGRKVDGEANFHADVVRSDPDDYDENLGHHRWDNDPSRDGGRDWKRSRDRHQGRDEFYRYDRDVSDGDSNVFFTARSGAFQWRDRGRDRREVGDRGSNGFRRRRDETSDESWSPGVLPAEAPVQVQVPEGPMRGRQPLTSPRSQIRDASPQTQAMQPLTPRQQVQWALRIQQEALSERFWDRSASSDYERTPGRDEFTPSLGQSEYEARHQWPQHSSRSSPRSPYVYTDASEGFHEADPVAGSPQVERVAGLPSRRGSPSEVDLPQTPVAWEVDVSDIRSTVERKGKYKIGLERAKKAQEAARIKAKHDEDFMRHHKEGLDAAKRAHEGAVLRAKTPPPLGARKDHVPHWETGKNVGTKSMRVPGKPTYAELGQKIKQASAQPAPATPSEHIPKSKQESAAYKAGAQKFGMF